MDSNKAKDRNIRQILINIFPKINREALDEVLNRPSNDNSLNSSAMDSDINLINMSDSVLNTEDSSPINDYETFNRTSSKFDHHYNTVKNPDNYLRAVRKAVTTLNLPTLPKIELVKPHVMPSFLKKTFKSIIARLGTGANDINKLKFSAFAKNDTVFALNAGGSTDTDYAFEIATKRFAHINDNQKFIFAYIFPTLEEDKTNNYRNKKDIVTTTYQNNMRHLDGDRFFFYGEERNTKNYSHPIEQVEKLSEKCSVDYILTGFNGLKGSKGDNKFLEKGLQIMLRIHRTPFIVVKESCFQNPESSLEGLTWLFVFDKINTKCFNSFKKFSPLIDFSRDKVCAYSLIPNSNPFDDIEPLFMKEINSRQVTKYSYEFERYNDEPHVYANKKVNFGNIRYDFVVLYNNIAYSEFTKNTVEKQMISNMHIVLGASSNICVMNGN